MKISLSLFPAPLLTTAAIVLTLGMTSTTAHASDPALVDDFSNPSSTAHSAARLLVDDRAAGSQSHAAQRCENGVLIVEGELIPGRGAPAFISVPLLLSPEAKPKDLSGYEGVRLRVKVLRGSVSVQVSTTDIQNFDYHTAPVAARRGESVEVRVPFKDFKRAWSEQTPLNAKAVTSVNLVAFGLAKSPFAYEVDEIGFY